MKKLFCISFILLTMQLFCVGQNIPASILIECRDISSKPYYCLRGTIKRYSGMVSGYVIPRQTNIGCVEMVASLLQSYCLDNSITKKFNYWDIPVFIEGTLKNGKEIGNWKLINMDGQKVASLYFDSLENIQYEIFLKDSLIFKGSANSNVRKRKKSNGRFKKNDFIPF